jgi:hypothetical protein
LDFLFQLRLRHHCIERWLGIGTLFWPDAVTPVNVLDSSLISYALCKRQRSLGNLRWRFDTKEGQQCSGYHRTGSGYAKKKNN